MAYKHGTANAALRSLKVVDGLMRPASVNKDLTAARRFLFLMYSPALGTSLTETPVLEALKSVCPDCQIGVAAAGLPYEVIRNSPHVAYSWRTPSAETDLLGAAGELRRQLRNSGFSPEFVCTNSWNRRTKTVLLGYLAGRFCRIGFAVHPELLEHSIQYDDRLSIIENNLSLLSLLGSSFKHLEPSIFFSRADQERASSYLGNEKSGFQPTAVLITQGSGSKPREWPAPNFAEVADFLVDLGFRVVFIGNKANVCAIEQIRGRMKSPATSLAGQTDVPTLAAVLAQCDLAVGIDTGASHLARAVRLPLVLLPAPNEPFHVWWPTLPKYIFVIRKGEEKKGGEDMDAITAHEVREAIETVIAAYPPAPSCRLSRLSRCVTAPAPPGT
jgi:ADP-heptose:LPS heptosyltransferase